MTETVRHRPFEMIRGLEQKIDIVQVFIEEALQMPRDADPKTYLDSLFDGAAKKIPVDELAKYKKGLERRVIPVQVLTTLLARENKMPTPYQVEGVEKLARESKDALPDDLKYLSFIDRLWLLRNNLVQKAFKVRGYGHDLRKILDDAETRLKTSGELGDRKIDAQKVTIWRGEPASADNADPFATVLAIDDSYFAKLWPDAGGFHLLHTPLIFIAQSYIDKILHERLHNWTESLVRNADPAPIFESFWNQFVITSLPDNIDAAPLVNALQGELISAVTHADFNFKNKVNWKMMRLLEIPLSEYEHLSSAGNEFEKLIRKIEEITPRNQAEERTLSTLLRDLKERFDATVDGIATATRLLAPLEEKEKRRATTRLIIAMCFLEPTQYRHLPTLIRRGLKRSSK